MNIYLNSDDESYASVFHYVRLLENMGIRGDSNSEIALNICSVGKNKMRKGSRCTIYIEGDEFLIKGKNTDIYDQVDLLYICNKGYLSYYPDFTKILQSGVDPEWHYPRDVQKEYDYIFVGKISGDPVYDHRREVLEKLKSQKWSVQITQCSAGEYPNLLSKGRIILNVLPRLGKDVSANYRLLEGCAIGCLMTDRDQCVDDLGLIPNVHYLPIERFGDISDEEIARIHKAGREYVCKNFSYQNAIKRIIKDAELWMENTST